MVFWCLGFPCGATSSGYLPKYSTMVNEVCVFAEDSTAKLSLNLHRLSLYRQELQQFPPDLSLELKFNRYIRNNVRTILLKYIYSQTTIN